MKKKHYNQPAVQVAQYVMESMILSGSPAPAPSGDMGIYTDVPTTNQW